MTERLPLKVCTDSDGPGYLLVHPDQLEEVLQLIHGLGCQTHQPEENASGGYDRWAFHVIELPTVHTADDTVSIDLALEAAGIKSQLTQADLDAMTKWMPFFGR